MRRSLGSIFWLGIKELASLGRDPVMAGLIVYAFTVAVYAVATGARMEVINASIAIVDDDRSTLSREIGAAFLPPYFQEPARLAAQAVDAAMADGSFTFVLDIPPAFERDLLAGRRPELQVNVDATAMSQAGAGAGYVQAIIERTVETHLARETIDAHDPIDLVTRVHFNPNLRELWFKAVMQVINAITILSVVLVGAAVIREREQETLEHLLVMPLRAIEVMLAKVWANGLVILVAATASLYLVVNWFLGVPIVGSVGLFVSGAVVYLFSVTSLGILLATVARTMPQFGLLAIPVFIVMYLLSGATTPLEAMPEILQTLMQAAPATHFVSFAQAVLYRGADLTIVWPWLAAMAGLGIVFFSVALVRFRRILP